MSGLIAIAIAPYGSTAYVLNSDNKTLVPVGLDSGANGTPIPINVGPGQWSSALPIAPDGGTVYVLNSGTFHSVVVPVRMDSGHES